jgi:hypothetical protein
LSLLVGMAVAAAAVVVFVFLLFLLGSSSSELEESQRSLFTITDLSQLRHPQILYIYLIECQVQLQCVTENSYCYPNYV